jgi:hypothetical protein
MWVNEKASKCRTVVSGPDSTPIGINCPRRTVRPLLILALKRKVKAVESARLLMFLREAQN